MKAILHQVKFLSLIHGIDNKRLFPAPFPVNGGALFEKTAPPALPEKLFIK
jgi:hypothetical protein